MQTRSSNENSVCPSLRQTCELWQKGRNICPDFYTIRKNICLFFWEEEWLVGDDPFYLKFWVNWTHWSEITDFELIITHSTSAVTASENSSINANRKSPTCFPMSLRWSSCVAPKPPKEGAQKRKTAIFCLKSHFACRKPATKFLYVKTVSDLLGYC